MEKPLLKSKIEQFEMLRGLASLYVLATHVFPLNAIQNHPLLSVLLRFGQEAVMCFFLLSGFVVYFSTSASKDRRFKTYFVRRFTRIYPVFLIALVIAGGVALSSGEAVAWRDLPGNLFMLQDYAAVKPGVWVMPFGGNFPLWSLSYEWWFYMMFFPIFSRVPEHLQLALVSALSAVGLLTYAWLPNQISLFLLYFIIWWSGLELARTYFKGRIPNFQTQKVSLLVLGGFCVAVPAVLFGLMPAVKPLSLGMHPILESRHFLAAFGLVLGGMLWARCHWIGFRRLFGGFAFFAPISYAMYVFHYPICVRATFLNGIANTPLRSLAAVALTMGLAYLAEVPLQRLIKNWLRVKKPLPARGPELVPLK